ncbi:hypothetical protein D3C75_1167370 [compost metagenome]
MRCFPCVFCSVVDLAAAFSVTLPGLELRVVGFAQGNVAGTASAVVRLRHAKRLYGVEFCQPARQIAAHDIRVGVRLPTFTVDDNQIAQAVSLGLTNKGIELLTALFNGQTK